MIDTSHTTKVFLEGRKILLRPLSLNDVSKKYLSWLNDPETNAYNSHAIFPYTKEELISYVGSASQDKSKIILAVVDKKTDQHIGNVALQNIDWVARSAELAILIGEKSLWGKGIASEASTLIVRYAMERLNLHRIHCGTSSVNLAMKKLALKIGMKQEGRRREAFFKNGKYRDIIEFGILKRELNKRNPHK